ncbi:AI-2E family transporter [Mangrovicoccus algicola]|uniref:AI-2E family transporter n=1 Tax=Mangrovicoccus algicola TaxID=2771008 RepID=A0A8J7CHL7_9RHOB|nr:AI-2E family transporter [Mangrovicoccus algicola]MBE3638340.1 AI-2E family transporter [Mangrovicoccus algicola]
MLQTLFLSLGIALMAGWILIVGKAVIVPVLAAVIAVYVLINGAAWLRRWTVLRRCPAWLLQMVILAGFVVGLFSLAAVVAVTLEEMADRAPAYQANLETLAVRIAEAFGAESDPTWADIRRLAFGQLDLPARIGGLFSSLTSLLGSVLIVIIYAGFLMGQWASFPRRIAEAFGTGGNAAWILEIGGEINRRIGDYLTVKTLVNLVLGLLSYAVLWAMDVDFALFWAVCIGLLNYIPYLGSWLGVMLPVILSVAQFGDIWRTLLLTLLLTVMQIFVGSVLEPRWIGRQLNLSPFAVILALSFWSALWGISGAILAVPLTSVLVIIFSAFPGTRPIAVLISDVAHSAPPPERREEIFTSGP